MKIAPYAAKFLSHRWRTVLLFVLAYVPILATQPGKVSADTKTYLFLHPGELLSEASSLWSSSVGAGTVTHQYIGYLWPMGPFFWIADALGSPDWLAQRIWWGSLIFFASWGALRLAKAVGISPNFALIAALIYGFSPYALHYLARLSGILLPWVGLPWLLLCLVYARKTTGWKWPARSALIIGTIGTVNATALFFILVGLGLWLACDVLAGWSKWRESIGIFIKIGIGSVGVSVWWITSLTLQSAYGLPILRYTETYDTVAKASLPQELIRGLGYWFFYGDEYGGRWIGPSAPYMYNRLVIVAGFLVAAIGLVSLITVTSRYRLHLGVLTLVGLGISVGASPLSNSSLYGRFFEKIVNNESGFALRSTPRALPLVLIALALATAFALEAWSSSLGELKYRFAGTRFTLATLIRTTVVTLVVASVAINNFPWFTQRAMTESITRDESVPTYWTEAADIIDATRDASTGFARTYEFPAANFADYWWGGTVDPILPGLITSEYVAKEMVPQGSEATTDLLSAFESKMVDGRPDMSVLGSLAAIMSANTVTWRADLAYDRHLTARPEYLATSLSRTPPGQSIFTGPTVATNDNVTIADESWFGNTLRENYPLLNVWKIPQPRPLLTHSQPNSATVLVGSGEGVINSLSAQLLRPTDTFIYAGTLPYLPSSFSAQKPTRLIVTDTNRKAERQWSSIAQQVGRTEQADEITTPRKPTDQRLNPFTDDYRQTVAVEQMTTSRLVGDIERVRASSYGHPVVLTPEARPENAIDGDPRSSWIVGVRSSAVNEWIQIDYRRPITASELNFDFSQRQPGNRLILRGRVDLRDNAGKVLTTAPIVFTKKNTIRVTFPTTTFTQLRFTIEDESLAGSVDYSTAPGIGIGEISVPGVSNREFIAAPQIASSLLQTTQTAQFVLSRQYVDPSIPHRSDAEMNIQRIITSPSSKNFVATGLAQLAGRATETVLSQIANLNQATSNQRILGSAHSIASLAIDGKKTTAWITPFDDTVGSEIFLNISPQSPSRQLRLDVRDDRFHSLPRIITVTDGAGEEKSYGLVTTAEGLTAQLSVDTQFPIQSIRIDEIEERTFRNYFTRQPRQLPVAINEIDFGVANPIRNPTLSAECRNDLLFINDTPAPIRLVAPDDLFDTTQNIVFESCGPLQLRSGENFIRTAKGLDAGIDINQLVLREPTDDIALSPYSPMTITSRNTTRITAQIDASTPQIISFGQSINKGWKATLRTPEGDIDLGEPFVVQGYANGWLAPGAGELILEWTPQRFVLFSLVFSLATALGLSVLALRRTRQKTQTDEALAHQPSRRTRVTSIVVFLGLIVLFAGFLAGAVSLVLLTLARRWSMLAVSVVMAIVATVIVVNQTRYGYPSTLDWPLRFVDLAPLTWMAVAIASINPLARRE